MSGIERDIAALETAQRQAWEMDLDLRRQAESSPELAEIIAQADAQYLAKYGNPWINPLMDDAS